MRWRQILLMAGLSVLAVSLALVAWEFYAEKGIEEIFATGLPTEAAVDRWDFVEFGIVITLIAVLVPVSVALWLTAQQAAAERELDLAQERVKVIAANPDWLWEVDENAVYTYASPKVRDLLGYAPEEVVGKTPFDLMPPDEAERVAAEFAPIAAERRPFTLLENVNRHKDGRLVVIETSGVPIFDKDGTYRGYRGIDRDITQRKAMEQQVAEQRALLAAVFDAIPDAIGTATFERRFLTINRGFAETFGYTQAEIEGQPTSIIYQNEEEFRREGEIRFNPAADNPQVPSVINYRRKNGEVFPAEVRGAPIRDTAGNKVGAVAVIRDISERVALEHRLREARKMEAIGQLTAGIAHDFNNMLQIVQGNIDLAVDLSGDNDRVRGLLTAALQSSQRGAALTRQLLSFARRDILHPRPIDPARLIGDRIALLKKTLGDSVTLVTDLDCGLPSIEVDPHTLETVLLNIAANARAAMPEGGTLTIRATTRELAEDLAIEDGSLSAGRYVELALTDTGCGMSDAVREKAFEPFFTTHPVGEGNGLGLSVVQGFVRQSGGHVALTSAAGRGTTVTLLLPAASDAE